MFDNTIVFRVNYSINRLFWKSKKCRETINPNNAFKLILDLNKILGKSIKEVTNVLGEPETVQEFYAPSDKNLNRTIYKGNNFVLTVRLKFFVFVYGKKSPLKKLSF